MRSSEAPAAVRRLIAQALSPAAFAPFGDVIAVGAGGSVPINAGSAQRFDGLTQLDFHAQGGVPCVAIFRTSAQMPTTSHRLSVMERHLLGSQTFVPLGQGRCLAVLALGDAAPDEDSLQAFIVEPGQGITLHRGIWHHPLLTLGAADVLVIERQAAVVDCEVVALVGQFVVGLDDVMCEL
jgi:ureidoglycolate lyase